MAICKFTKDPDALLDYGFNWATWLSTDTISTSTWYVPDDLTNESDGETTTATTIWLSGGTRGVTYTVTNRITTAGGRTDERSFQIRVTDR
jgi:hypothetical protein